MRQSNFARPSSKKDAASASASEARTLIINYLSAVVRHSLYSEKLAADPDTERSVQFLAHNFDYLMTPEQ
ncbi:hypothetical protein C8R31_101350 [Nitrosospira sp. Nsp2]|nr:hypothetical protein C8R31_101350 [Nitrosospira sp. Nsp2]